jgi:hypothetical protein
LPSLHDFRLPGTHCPAEQTSPVVHAFPSLHGTLFGTWLQLPGSTQTSFVHALSSSQSIGTPAQEPPAQASDTVQGLPSSQDPATGVNLQPVNWSQPSLVQTLPSEQVGGAPPTQEPPVHLSLVVHALPSLHAFVFGVNLQPPPASQPSSVHGLLSLHWMVPVPVHAPPEHLSLFVQALPSSQVTEFGTFRQPSAASHESSVHGLKSSQSVSVPPPQLPLRQISASVQASPSSHAPAAGWNLQPVAGSQKSDVQVLSSLHTTGVWLPQTPLVHLSFEVHALPSLHDPVKGELMHPNCGLHESAVQGLPSLQPSVEPDTHSPSSQVSWTVHSEPSEQRLPSSAP